MGGSSLSSRVEEEVSGVEEEEEGTIWIGRKVRSEGIFREKFLLAKRHQETFVVDNSGFLCVFSSSLWTGPKVVSVNDPCIGQRTIYLPAFSPVMDKKRPNLAGFKSSQDNKSAQSSKPSLDDGQVGEYRLCGLNLRSTPEKMEMGNPTNPHLACLLVAVALTRDKRLLRFFNPSASPRKRLRTALEFTKVAAEEEREIFFVGFKDNVFSTVVETVEQYEKMKLDE